MSWHTGGSVIRFPKEHRMWNRVLSHRPQRLHCTTAFECTINNHVMYWKGKRDSMKPEERGWHIVDGKCLPIQTDKPAAPAELLDIVSCSCKHCATQRGAHVDNMARFAVTCGIMQMYKL